MDQEERYRKERDEMLRSQIEGRGIRNSRLLEAMYRVPRHLFVPPEFREKAYFDGPLPIGMGQTISQPYMVAAMTDLLNLKGNEMVLEIGTGSGYQAAVLSRMAREVHTIERHPDLAKQSTGVLEALGYSNVFVHVGDGTLGWPPSAPYQGILVTAAAPRPPDPLIAQLDEDGLLVIPVGGQEGQDLQRWKKVAGSVYRESLFPVAFVPLRGSHGWLDEEWQDRDK
jgi:protein-L-isoaspartate(D-aspartate) O-methyltransferase